DFGLLQQPELQSQPSDCETIARRGWANRCLRAERRLAGMASGEKMTRVVLRLLDMTIGGVFIYAGVAKAFDPARFAADIDNYRLLPWHAVVAASLYLPWVEIASGVALIVRCWYCGGLAILTALASVFLAALVSAQARGLDISCGCFG